VSEKDDGEEEEEESKSRSEDSFEAKLRMQE
jgi:hypothetical protein